MEPEFDPHTKKETINDAVQILLDFEPYRVTFTEQTLLIGRVDVIFPDHHINIEDPSTGGVFLGADVRRFPLHMDISEPGLTAGEIIKSLLLKNFN